MSLFFVCLSFLQLTLNGSCGDIFIFLITGDFSSSANSHIVLTGGLTSKTVYWIISTKFVTGASSSFSGTIVALTNVVIAGTLSGRIYSGTEIALQNAVITPSAIGNGPIYIRGVCESPNFSPSTSSAQLSPSELAVAALLST